MPEFDTVIQGGTIATAAAVFPADIGIKDGRITALGAALGQGRDEIDTSGRLVLPGGVDAHCHLDQPSTNGSVCADDFRSGTTTVIPFAAQMKGQLLRAATGKHRRRRALQSRSNPFRVRRTGQRRG